MTDTDFVTMLREIADKIESGEYPNPSWSSEIETRGRKHVFATGYKKIAFRIFDKTLEDMRMS